MLSQDTRTELLVGKQGIDKLKNSTVIIFGVGGVGSFVAEALARSSVGHIILVDDCDICISNVNRQVHSLLDTVGQPKIDVMKTRINQINKNIKVTTLKKFVTSDNIEEFINKDIDYIVDAIDTITSKLLIIEQAKKYNIRIISSMGVGNKINPQLLQIKDIFGTSVCPMARVMRKELKRLHIKDVLVCYSEEKPIKHLKQMSEEDFILEQTETRKGTIRRQNPGSISFMPSCAGLFIAGQVVRDLLGIESVYR